MDSKKPLFFMSILSIIESAHEKLKIIEENYEAGLHIDKEIDVLACDVAEFAVICLRDAIKEGLR